jgi:putative two-component system response regulator
MAYRIALAHHERWDSTRYPVGLAGNDIRLEGRITVVSDVFDALSSQPLCMKAFSVDGYFRIVDEG